MEPRTEIGEEEKDHSQSAIQGEGNNRVGSPELRGNYFDQRNENPEVFNHQRFDI